MGQQWGGDPTELSLAVRSNVGELYSSNPLIIIIMVHDLNIKSKIIIMLSSVYMYIGCMRSILGLGVAFPGQYPQ